MWFKDLYKIKYDCFIIEFEISSQSTIHLEVLKANAHQDTGEQKLSTVQCSSVAKEELKDSNKYHRKIRFECQCISRSDLLELVIYTGRIQEHFWITRDDPSQMRFLSYTKFQRPYCNSQHLRTPEEGVLEPYIVLI